MVVKTLLGLSLSFLFWQNTWAATATPVKTPAVRPAAQIPVATPANPVAKTVAPPAPAKTLNPEIKRWRSFFVLNFVSWQESIVLTGSDNKKNNLEGVTQGMCPGVDFISAFSTRFAFQLDACALFANSQLTNSSSSPSSDLQYQASGSHARGLVSSIGILWTPPHAEKTRFGFSIPIVFRSTDWPDPVAGSTLSTSTSAVLSGAMIEEQFDLGKFLFVIKTGVLSSTSTSNFSWNIRLGYNWN